MMNGIAVRRLPVLAATLMLLFVGVSYAVGNAPMTTTTVQSMNGVILRVTGAFTVIGTGYFPVTTTSPATVGCTWPANAGCVTALTSGDWFVNVVLQLNTPPTTTTSYTISLEGNFVGAISFAVPSTATANSAVSFGFDLATTTINSPAAYVIIVQ